MTTSLLTTKLTMPSLRVDCVPRQSLFDRLDRGLSRKLILISAPAGFGKTTLLGAWLQSRAVKTAWLALDSDDDHPARFMAYCVGALARCVPALIAPTRQLLAAPQPPPPEAVVRSLINDLAGLDEDLLLVLDDYHLIRSEGIHAALNQLLDHTPPHLHLAIATRADPPLNISRLRGRDELVELRTDDLRFSVDETTVFLNRVMGLKLASDLVNTLNVRTEGWATGLQMAGIALRDRDDIQGFVEAFAGSNRYVLDYLVEEVWQRLPPDLQSFLLQTSILTRMAGPVCNAVTGRDDSQQVLETLERGNIFVVPLDDQRHWYRYHRLFKDLLLHRLAMLQPDSIPNLHRKASTWYRQQQDFPGAIEHALYAEDFDSAADLIEEIAQAILMRSEVRRIMQWLEALPEPVLAQRPTLCLYRIWAMMLSGAPLSQVEAQIETLDQEAAPIGGQIDALRAFMLVLSDRNDESQMLARRALDRLPEENAFFRSFAAWALAANNLLELHLETSEARFAELAEQTEQSGNLLVAVSALSGLAALKRHRGQLHEAEHIYRRALDLAVDGEGRLLPIAGEALMGLGRLHWYWADYALAEDHFIRGIALSCNWRKAAAIEGYLALAAIRQTQGDLTAADAAIETARGFAREFDATTIDDMVVEMVNARLHLQRGETAPATRWAVARGLDLNAPDISTIAPGLLSLARYELLVLAHLLLTLNRPEDALHLLNGLAENQMPQIQITADIEIQILRAVALDALGQNADGLAALSHALTVAQPPGIIRIFVEAGPRMARLLYQAIEQGIMPAFAGRILAAFPDEPASPPPSAIIEPLSPRELEVVACIAAGLTNAQIASQLVISVFTVKKHVTNIFGKLGVTTRTQAVARARDYGLLD